MSNSLLSLTQKSEFQGVYLKETKKGKAFIVRFTSNKKTRTQIVGYEKNGMSAYDAYKIRLNLIADLQLASALNGNDVENLFFPKLFLEFLEFKNPMIAKNTRENYKSIYNQYISADFKTTDVRNVTANDLQIYINKLLTYRRPATVEKIVSAFKKFYTYLQDNGIYRYNPSASLIMPKYDNKKYFSMPKKDVKKFLVYVNNIENQLHKTLYLVLLHGRRFNETVTLPWSSVDLTKGLYFLNYTKTKTRKNQYYYLEDFQIKALQKLRLMYPDAKYVFEKPKTKNPITYTTFFRVHQECREKLNLPDFTIHSIRHLIAFLIVNNGYSLEVTAKVLGHQNIQSTQRYAILEMEKAKKAYSKTINHLLL